MNTSSQYSKLFWSLHDCGCTVATRFCTTIYTRPVFVPLFTAIFYFIWYIQMYNQQKWLLRTIARDQNLKFIFVSPLMKLVSLITMHFHYFSYCLAWVSSLPSSRKMINYYISNIQFNFRNNSVSRSANGHFIKAMNRAVRQALNFILKVFLALTLIYS